MEVVASLSQGRIAAAQCGLFTHKSVPVIFEPPRILFGNKSMPFGGWTENKNDLMIWELSFI